MTTPHGIDAPAEFRAALETIGARRVRPEVALHEVPSPRRVAPFSAALTGHVAAPGGEDAELASGRFVVLHDPDGQETWRGRFRVVTLVRASLEPEMATDALFAEVAWTWLTDALRETGAAAHTESGTVSRVLSQSFGALAGRPDDVELELRASWTPATPDLGAHLEAWAELLCTAAGLPPRTDGVTPLPASRHTVVP
ncbi:DUF3000 domain-containing protein [Cellulosimicrobium sp. CUA-896]|uniref:DUF3000 domain-containing protein n=1 Tax=Cellulosimicrobium sp. CUA-896 TaxID=1517881 RepID=UPI000961760A|nr:DUF3000 domain-containing protein [Cellulosimicrobium sp. CUA-896]OLT53118.1 enoyl-CoA hydratase [Cellulosimicrobium sp. CUA-896]